MQGAYTPFVRAVRVPNDTLTTRATIRIGDLNGNGTTGTFPGNVGAVTFELAQLPNVTSYQTLFDAYRVTRMNIRIIPQFNSADQAAAGTSATGIMPIVIARDQDDAVLPTSEAQLLTYGSSRQFMLDRIINYSIVPRTKTSADNSGTMFLESRLNQWIPTDSHRVPHYGIKFWAPTNLSAYENYAVYLDVEVGFKNTK